MNFKIAVNFLFSFFISLNIFAQYDKAKFPEFNLEDGYGKTISSKNLVKSDNLVVLLIYGAWGEPCNKSVTTMNNLQKDWKRKYSVDIKVIAAESKSATVNWLKKEGDLSNSYYDVDDFLVKEAGVRSCPLVVICNSNQEIVYSRLGFIHMPEQLDEIISFLEIEKVLKEKPNASFEIKYDDGSLLAVGSTSSGKLDKLFKDYYRNKQIKSIGNYKIGKLEGEWKKYLKDGNLESVGSYTDNEMSGNWKYYHSEGNVRATGNMVAGKQQDEWKYYFTNGKISAIGKYNKSEETGEWKNYYENGTLKSIQKFKDGKLEGESTNYDQDGNLIESGKYENNKKAGQWKEYHLNGKLKSSGNYVNGKKDGEWTSLYQNNLVSKILLYSDGKVMEILICKDDKGNMLSKGTLQNGNGTEKVYFPDGKIDTINTYLDGILL